VSGVTAVSAHPPMKDVTFIFIFVKELFIDAYLIKLKKRKKSFRREKVSFFRISED